GCDPGTVKPSIQSLPLQAAARDVRGEKRTLDADGKVKKVITPKNAYEDAWSALLDCGASALAANNPYEALSCGTFLWQEGREQDADEAFRLLDGGYALLGREGVRRVLKVHHENRRLESVDILGDDSDEDDSDE